METENEMRKFEGYQRGVNLGGWLSQADETTKAHYDTFITEADIAQIAAMGLDHVRIPVDYTMIESEDGQPLEEGYQYIDKAVHWCQAHGLHVLIDMHNTYGYTFDPLAKGADREIFFRNASLQKRFFAMWDRISSCYGNCPNTAFELLNEVISPAIAEEWNCIADRTVDIIRKNAPQAWIVIGGVRYNNVTSVPMLHKPKDDHIVYNFHCYEPLMFTHQRAYWVENMPDLTIHYPEKVSKYRELSNGLSDNLVGAVNEMDGDVEGPALFETLFAPAVEAAERNGAPLYCGEYGVIDQAPSEDALRWIIDIHSVFEKYGIGRSLWNYKEKDFGLMDSHYEDVRSELVKYL